MWEEDANAAHGPRQRILLSELWEVLRRVQHAAATNGALLLPAEWGGGRPISDHRWDNKVFADDSRDAQRF